MKKTILNFVALLVIGFGGYNLSTPNIAYACPDCRTCTGGCTGCFGDDCDGSGNDCGTLEDSNGNFIQCGTGDDDDFVID